MRAVRYLDSEIMGKGATILDKLSYDDVGNWYYLIKVWLRLQGGITLPASEAQSGS